MIQKSVVTCRYCYRKGFNLDKKRKRIGEHIFFRKDLYTRIATETNMLFGFGLDVQILHILIQCPSILQDDDRMLHDSSDYSQYT